jgi:hypothetical protein
MRLRQLLLAGTGALLLGALSVPANAAPAIGTDLKAAAGETSAVDRAAYRRCWRHRGHLHCRHVVRSYRYAPYDYDDGYYDYGYGPSIGLSFGGGGFRGGHRGGHHRHR